MTTAYSEIHEGRLAPRPRSARLTWTSIVLSLGLLGVSIAFADSRQVLAQLAKVDARWLAVAFVVSLLQLALLGTRYAHIARAVGLKLSWLKGTTEYALSVLINQVLPTGLMGDGLRAARQSRDNKAHGLLKGLQAVALDRIAGYLALWAVVFATAPFGADATLLNLQQVFAGSLAIAAAACLLGVALRMLGSSSKYASAFVRFFTGGLRVLATPKQFIVHVPLSLALIVLHLVQLYIAARAIDVQLSLSELMWLGPLVLLAMSVPSFFAGWGIREGASALLFAAIGLAGSSGVAVALVYGAFSLVVSLPGVMVLLFESGRSDAERTRWSQAHSVSMLVGLGLALWTGFLGLLACFAVLSFLILIVQSRQVWTPQGKFGAANSVTSFRLLLVLVLLFGHLGLSGPELAVLVIAVLLLDVVDGWLARRTSAASGFGAVYDVEVDTVLVAALSLVLLAKDQAGVWVAVPCMLRYLYVLAPLVFPTGRQAHGRTGAGRASYIFMMAAFAVALVVPSVWAYPMTLLGTAVMGASFVVSFWQRYAPQ